MKVKRNVIASNGSQNSKRIFFGGKQEKVMCLHQINHQVNIVLLLLLLLRVVCSVNCTKYMYIVQYTCGRCSMSFANIALSNRNRNVPKFLRRIRSIGISLGINSIEIHMLDLILSIFTTHIRKKMSVRLYDSRNKTKYSKERFVNSVYNVYVSFDNR